jgi:hypothetical protein
MYRYRSLASQLKVTVDGVAAQQARHFRGINKDIPAAIRAAIKAVMSSGTDLVSVRLENIPEVFRTGILDENRSRGRFDVQLEIEIVRDFTLRTDHMALRCLDLARLSLNVSPGEQARRFLSRVGRSYVLGLFPESVIMCRAALEQSVHERFQRSGKPFPKPATGKSEMRAGLARAAELRWVTKQQATGAWMIWQRGNKAVHYDPYVTVDVLGTIAETMVILDALHADLTR